MSEATRARALPGVLLFVVMVTGIISSLGAPLIPSISDDLGVSLSSAQWSLTATLLIGVVSSPVMGRLGDGPRRRETLLGGLAVVIAGCVLAALAGSLPLLVVGRAMQGVGLGLVPLGMATARDEMPAEKVAGDDRPTLGRGRGRGRRRLPDLRAARRDRPLRRLLVRRRGRGGRLRPLLVLRLLDRRPGRREA